MKAEPVYLRWENTTPPHRKFYEVEVELSLFYPKDPGPPLGADRRPETQVYPGGDGQSRRIGALGGCHCQAQEASWILRRKGDQSSGYRSLRGIKRQRPKEKIFRAYRRSRFHPCLCSSHAYMRNFLGLWPYYNVHVLIQCSKE